MIGKDLEEQIEETVPAIVTRRFLLGFMQKPRALTVLENGFSLRNPVDPTLSEEELFERKEENREEFTRIWEEAFSNKEDPPSWSAGRVELEELPDHSDISDYLDKFSSQDHFQQMTSRFPEDSWGIRLIPIAPLVAFQWSVAKEGHRDIPTRADDGLLEVVKYCLPVRGNKYVMTRGIQSGIFQGVQLVSRGPNINVYGPTMDRDPESDNISVTFQIRPNINIVQVVYFGGRYILKNGYHRCYQLLKAGETHVPALVRNVDNYQETGAAGDLTAPREVVMSDRPPLLFDFQTDAAVDVDSAGENKVIRILAETTTVRR